MSDSGFTNETPALAKFYNEKSDSKEINAYIDASEVNPAKIFSGGGSHTMYPLCGATEGKLHYNNLDDLTGGFTFTATPIPGLYSQVFFKIDGENKTGKKFKFISSKPFDKDDPEKVKKSFTGSGTWGNADASNPSDDGSGVPTNPEIVMVSLSADAYSEKNSLTVEAGTLYFVGEYYEKKKKQDFTNNNDLHSWEKERKASGTLTFHEGAGFASGDEAVFNATKVKHRGVNNEDVTITFKGFREVNGEPVSATFKGKGDIRANDTGSGVWKEIKVPEERPEQD